MPTAPCKECHSGIDATASRCPECGYSPQDRGKTARKVCVVAGFILSATVVAAPIGIPMVVVGLIAERKKDNQTAAQTS